MTQRTIFITGAAAGIGQAIARHFVGAGWQVGAYDVDLAGLKALQDELGSENLLIGQLDVTDRAAWDEALQAFVDASEQKTLNALVNNAGILDSGKFQDIEMQSHHRIIDINVKGVMNGCHAAFSHLAGQAGSCIVNLASASAIYGQPDLASYSASKFAVRGLTEGLNLEWEEHGIRVVDIWPLFVQTKMVEGMKADSIDRLGVKLSPKDVANTVYAAVNSKDSKVHWTVGWESGVFATLIRLIPSGFARRVAKQLAS